MNPRFWLRFEAGERSGERVPVPPAGLTVGRNPDNALILSSASVSGRHSKLTVADEDVVLRDLGSTNGTRVGGERVESRLLRHGDTLRLGNVVLTFLDGEREDVPPVGAEDAPLLEGLQGGELEIGPELELEPGPPAAPPGAGAPAPRPDLSRTVLAQEATESPAAAGEAVGRIAAERVARAAPRSALAGLALLALAAGGTALLLWRGRGGGPRAGRAEPVAVDPANLLGAGSSFEDEAFGEIGGWTANESAPAAFDRGAAWRATGRSGFGVRLAPGAWAEAASNEVIAPAVSAARGALVVSAAAVAEGTATLRLGLELGTSRAPARALVAWSEPLRGGRGTLEVAAGPVPGCDRARVLVQAFDVASDLAPELANAPPTAGAGGGADGEPGGPGPTGDEPAGVVGAAGVDDVALVARSAPVEPQRFEEYELHVLGTGAAALARIDRVLAWDLAFRAAAPARGALAERFAARAPSAAVTPGVGFELRAAPGAAPAAFTFRVDAELAGAGVATLGPDGRRTHPVAFEVEEATEILVGSGLDLLRFRLGAPCRVACREQDGALAVACTGELDVVVLQVAFREERARALRLADEARAAERAGDLGASLARWGELLDTLPFDVQLVDEAASTRAQLVQAGLERAQALSAEAERARFFDLADLHREVRGEARELAKRYRGSEVEEAVSALVADIDAELVRLEAGRREREAAVLGRVAEALERRGAEELARHVAAELAAHPAGAGAAAAENTGGGER